jgi:hypothetical protein
LVYVAKQVRARSRKKCKRLPTRERAGASLATESPNTICERLQAREINILTELGTDNGTYYHSQIGVLQWMVELGRVDIITEVSMLASHLACPREAHLEAVSRIFAYLDKKHNSRMVFDPTYPEIDMSALKECEWKEFYGEAKEPLPLNMPEPRGTKEVDCHLYVDSDHAGDRLIRRSQTRFSIFLNTAPLIWFSKRQPIVETLVFGVCCNEKRNRNPAMHTIQTVDDGNLN